MLHNLKLHNLEHKMSCLPTVNVLLQKSLLWNSLHCGSIPEMQSYIWAVIHLDIGYIVRRLVSHYLLVTCAHRDYDV